MEGAIQLSYRVTEEAAVEVIEGGETPEVAGPSEVSRQECLLVELLEVSNVS